MLDIRNSELFQEKTHVPFNFGISAFNYKWMQNFKGATQS